MFRNLIEKLNNKARHGAGSKQKPPLFGGPSNSSSPRIKQAPDVFGNMQMLDDVGNQAAKRQLYKNGGKVMSKSMSTAKPN